MRPVPFFFLAVVVVALGAVLGVVSARRSDQAPVSPQRPLDSAPSREKREESQRALGEEMLAEEIADVLAIVEGAEQVYDAVVRKKARPLADLHGALDDLDEAKARLDSHSETEAVTALKRRVSRLRQYVVKSLPLK